MIHPMRIQVAFLLVFCAVELINASCLSYGHSCWGAHGKRSYNPQQMQVKPTLEKSEDRWAPTLKEFPNRNELLLLRKIFRNSQFPSPYSENQIDASSPIGFESQNDDSQSYDSNESNSPKSAYKIPKPLKSVESQKSMFE